MKVNSIEINNFKRFGNSRLQFHESEKVELLIGSNNSGKTTLLNAMGKFLSPYREIHLYDFQINKWDEMHHLVEELISKNDENVHDKKKELYNIFPGFKAIIEYKQSEIHLVKNFLSTLEHQNNKVAFYIRFEPNNIEELLSEYKEYQLKIEETVQSWKDLNEEESDTGVVEEVAGHYWKRTIRDFLELDNNLSRFFSLKAYVANPVEDDIEYEFGRKTNISLQNIYSLIQVDTIIAGRYLSDVDSKGKTADSSQKVMEKESPISSLFTSFAHDYRTEAGTNEMDYFDLDYDLLKGNKATEEQLKEFYQESFGEVEEKFKEWGYPNINQPSITVNPKLELLNSIKSNADIMIHTSEWDKPLPESYNGLGYRNLLYIFLKLHQFNEDRRVRRQKGESQLHFVLIEEPEVHLHSPVQEVFIDQVKNIFSEEDFQIIISTHSNHIVDSVNFEQLHYFKVLDKKTNILRLDNLLLYEEGKSKVNDRFVKKYFELHSHNIFFADGIIMVEGSSEKVLIPHFIKFKDYYKNLKNKYIAVMEVNGAYAHLFYPLLKELGLPTLVITDIDSYRKGNTQKEHIDPNLIDKLITTNSSINKFFKSKEEITIECLLNELVEQKIDENINLCYQHKNYGDETNSIYARTFEDAFALENEEFLKEIDFREEFDVQGRGLLRKFKEIFDSESPNEYAEKLFKAIANNQKSDFALDLIYYLVNSDGETAISNLSLPRYIDDGLQWLNDNLSGDTNV
ncbi:AAA family ATPase [Halobacillus salinus]|uniref:AAA family ATPase n=1 Tax=Halobacillus salinus TaxID=192814 RepID=UPI001305151A|nr:AAA family ATPase [Halobacillus salinus]